MYLQINFKVSYLVDIQKTILLFNKCNKGNKFFKINSLKSIMRLHNNDNSLAY